MRNQATDLGPEPTMIVKVKLTATEYRAYLRLAHDLGIEEVGQLITGMVKRRINVPATKPGRPRKYSQADIEEMHRIAMAGHPYKDIAAIFGCTVAAVGRYINDYRKAAA